VGITATPLLAAPPTAADFLPIAAGGSAEVEQPSAVQVHETADRVEAASAQDAANAASDQTIRELTGSPANSAACFMTFPSGCGVFSTGKATYAIVANPELSRIAQRRAFVQAFMWAKKEMAQFLDGLTNEARDEIVKTMARLIEEKAPSATNRSTVEISTLKQDVSKLLKGFVVYEIGDQQKDGVGTVYVSIVASPATCLKTGRQAGGFVTESSLSEGVDRMVLEIRQGVVPPVGGRIIEVPGTGELAFVGFGAAVVGESGDPETQIELTNEAEQAAKMYAADALCGTIRGDQAAWTGTIVEKHRNSYQEFAEVQQGDPLNVDQGGSFQKITDAVKALVNTRVKTDDLTSARMDRMPPGTPIKSWTSDDGHWKYAVAIYAPSFSSKARELGKMMDEADLVPQSQGSEVLPSQRMNGGPQKVEGGAKQQLPSIEPLPGGKVGGQKL
jgi:hypothetical protein